MAVHHINTRMTTEREMEISYAKQQQVISLLNKIGHHDLAARLERCTTARQQRHYGDGWPYSCRSSACLWCRRAMVRGWWAGIRYWSEAAATLSLAIISIRSSAGLSDAAKRLRRGLRDVRDRTAQGFRRWRTVSFVGLIGGDHRALLLISHEGVDRHELQDVLSRRWPEMVLKDLAQEEPMWKMTPDDAAELGSRRRGFEPLRIMVMPQKITRVAVSPLREIGPMPVVI
jgi:hypothetical protein